MSSCLCELITNDFNVCIFIFTASSLRFLHLTYSNWRLSSVVNQPSLCCVFYRRMLFFVSDLHCVWLFVFIIWYHTFWVVGGRRVARNSQWGAVFGGLGAEPPALENFAFFLLKYLNFRAILIKNIVLKIGSANMY